MPLRLRSIGLHSVNVDREPVGKPPNLHPRIIMDLDLLGIPTHAQTAYLHMIYK